LGSRWSGAAGLALAISGFVFEERPHRLQRSLSDLNGTDPFIHHSNPDRVLIELSNALVRASEPSLEKLRQIHAVAQRAARAIRLDYGTLYSAQSFKALVLAATRAAQDS